MYKQKKVKYPENISRHRKLYLLMISKYFVHSQNEFLPKKIKVRFFVDLSFEIDLNLTPLFQVFQGSLKIRR